MKYFTEQHEWVDVDGDTATIGISEHAAAELGDITFIELPEMGAALDKGEALGVIESVKAAADIYSPVAGIVSAVNEALEDEPELVNNSAEVDGWICKLEGVDASGVDALMTTEAYTAFLQE
jgi:glycine cleavage system H protein